MPRRFDCYDLYLSLFPSDELVLRWADGLRYRDGVILAAAKTFLRLGWNELADPLLEALKLNELDVFKDTTISHPWRNPNGTVDELAQRRDVLKLSAKHWDPLPQNNSNYEEEDDIPF